MTPLDERIARQAKQLGWDGTERRAANRKAMVWDYWTVRVLTWVSIGLVAGILICVALIVRGIAQSAE